MVWRVCVRSAWGVDVGAGPHQRVARVWALGGWRSLWGLILTDDTPIYDDYAGLIGCSDGLLSAVEDLMKVQLLHALQVTL